MGWKEQFRRNRARDDVEIPIARRQLVFGLDFGTAFTKVVIGEARVSYAVPFGKLAPSDNAYLLPAAFSVGSDGNCSLNRNIGRIVSDLKMRILERPCSFTDEVEITAYLAMVLRHGREWLFAEHGSLYQQSATDWVINVGLPTDSYHNDELLVLYRKLIRAGWSLSLQDGPISLQSVEQMMSSGQTEHAVDTAATFGISEDAISPFPEFVAQITGYVRSPKRSEGLHCLVDVGAGTLDVTLFNVWQTRDGEDMYPIFGRAVERLGTTDLARYRVREANAILRVNPFDALPSDAEFARLLGIELRRLQEIDSEFNVAVHRCIFDQIQAVRHEYLPSRKVWEHGVPLFLCGGGARVDFYKFQISKMCELSQGFNIRQKQLAQPDRLEAPLIETNEFDRLSVAYGLAFDPFDLGEIVRQNYVEKADPVVEDDDPTGNLPGFVGSEQI